MAAWKYASAKMIDLNSACLAQLSTISSVKLEKARLRFCRMPCGGSLVSFTEFLSSEMGRPCSSAGGGSADRNRRNSSCAPS
eukprot:1740983-Pyramimonas_sp.AAC.1